MTKFNAEAFCKSIGELTVKAIRNAIAPLNERITSLEGLKARVAALEGRPPDGWQEQRGYAKGAAVAANGAIWIAVRDNAGEKPGTGDAWRLA